MASDTAIYCFIHRRLIIHGGDDMTLKADDINAIRCCINEHGHTYLYWDGEHLTASPAFDQTKYHTLIGKYDNDSSDYHIFDDIQWFIGHYNTKQIKKSRAFDVQVGLANKSWTT